MSSVPLSRSPTTWRARLAQPLSFRTQCVIAWMGLTGFAASGIPEWRSGDTFPILQGVAAVISVCWAIDIARGWRRTPER